MSVARLCAGVMVLALYAPVIFEPAVAQTQQQLDWCDHKNGATADLLIEGCTAVIAAGKYSGKGLAFAFNNRGIAYQNKGQYDRAIQDYGQAIKLDPNFAQAFVNRGFAYAIKAQTTAPWKTTTTRSSSIRIPPKLSTIAATLTWLKANTTAPSKTTIKRSSSIRNFAGAFNNRGVAYVHKEQYDRAIQDYDQAIRLNPNFASAFNNRGFAYSRNSQYDRAIQDYDQAIKLNPNYAKAFFNRSLAKSEKGDKAGAEADLATARRIDPNIGR